MYNTGDVIVTSFTKDKTYLVTVYERIHAVKGRGWIVKTVEGDYVLIEPGPNELVKCVSWLSAKQLMDFLEG